MTFDPVATIYPIVPEPCTECAEGLAWLTSFDGVFRCRNCVHRFAIREGLTDLPARYQKVERNSAMVDPVPEPPPPETTTYEQPRML